MVWMAAFADEQFLNLVAILVMLQNI